MRNPHGLNWRVRGITLVEILAVVVIIAIASALLFPVLAKSKASGLQASCAQQMRQIGMAMTMYQDTYEARPRSYAALEGTGLIRDLRLFVCPADPFKGLGRKRQECGGKKISPNYTYETTMTWFDSFVDRLNSVDPNHGVLACRVHGNRTEEPIQESNFCDANLFYYTGTLLRLRKDGSLQTARFRFRPARSKTEGPTSSIWDLYTDERDPLWKY